MGERLRSTHQQKGVTLIETLLALFVIGVAILAFGALSSYITLNSQVKHRAAAYNLALEELEALRDLGFAAFADRDDASPAAFMNVAYPFGIWDVTSTTDAASGSAVYAARESGVGTAGVTGNAVVPSATNFEATLSTFTAEAKVRVLSDSVRSDWEAGFYFRYQDENNYYLLALGDDRITLTRRSTDTTGIISNSTLYSATPTIQQDTWHTLRVRFTDDVSNNLSISLAGSTIFTTTEDTIPKGHIVLTTQNAAHAYFDDIHIATDTSNIPPAEPSWNRTWDFDTGETIGAVAAGWGRFGINDLPNTTPAIANDNAELTITEHAGNPDLKQIVATVQYEGVGGLQSVSLQTIISRYGTAK
ncbi:MAG: prepilin-type N-terminal cleavage/methylation domain-containing protein [Patescibacteria group bacterium]|jgi:prepilin-type N-terminal cleavage/methylation domain-containing protein